MSTLKRSIGHILPGIVKVEEVYKVNTEREPVWQITLLAPVGSSQGNMALLEAKVRFVTRDEALVQQIRQSNYRFVLDLVQLEAEDEDNGPLDVKEKPWSVQSDQVKSWEPVRAS